MNGRVASPHADPAEALPYALRRIEDATTQFPVSQLLTPWPDMLAWLLDDTAVEERWLDQLQRLRVGFGPRWDLIAHRALGDGVRETSDRALADPDYDPLGGMEPWGAELTAVLRAVLSEGMDFGGEAGGVVPVGARGRPFVRVVSTEGASLVAPILSYVPLGESEWQAIVRGLSDLVALALRFEGAVVAWLIGGFARDVEGRLQLRPELSLSPPPSGTRLKPLRVLLGTAYEEQCPSLIPLAHARRRARARASDALLERTPWHRLVVQLDVRAEDYVLLNVDRLASAEREIARRVMYLDQRPRTPHRVTGSVRPVPRPWQPLGAAPEAPAPPAEPVGEGGSLQEAAEAAEEGAPALPASLAALSRDAEALRQKGMAAVESDPVLAQKYLLASTILENNSIDVWLTLVDLASSEKQRASFRREAEKVLRRQRLEL
ncbi:MAG: hypothetical protein JXA09_04695 [Anaerolineae bacterium]|nr:hypothetical protein [Anaerolineae bacterium]